MRGCNRRGEGRGWEGSDGGVIGGGGLGGSTRGEY